MSKENLFERSFFQYKFTLPGALFFLVIIVLNIEYSTKIIDYIKTDEIIIDLGSSILFSGLSLLSLTSFGFLFNQFWYFCNNCISKKCFDTKNDPRIRYIVGDDYNKLFWKERMIRYHYYSNIANNKASLQNYLVRRWDMINVLGSSIFSIIFGSFAGTWLYYAWHPGWKDTSLCVLIPLILFFVIIMILIIHGIDRIREEHREMTRYVTQLMREQKKTP